MILFGTTIGYVFEDQPYRPQISQHPAGISPTKMGISPPTIGNDPAKIADYPPKPVDLPSMAMANSPFTEDFAIKL